MRVAELLERRLLLFTGKGGVGKSTVVASMSLAARQLGKRVLVVEMGTEGAMKRLFGLPQVGFEPVAVAPGLDTATLEPEQALADYVRSYVKVGGLARLILRHPLLKAFFRAAPGVYEFVTLHRLVEWVEARDAARPGGYAYDLVLVDLPATGHALRLLALPEAVRQLVGHGVMGRVVDHLETVLHDPKITALSLITLPEDMPVSETIELYDALRTKTRLPLGLLIVNAYPEALFDADEREVLARLDAMETKRLSPVVAQAREACRGERRRGELLAELGRRVGLTRLLLPALTGSAEADGLRTLANVCVTRAQGEAT